MALFALWLLAGLSGNAPDSTQTQPTLPVVADVEFADLRGHSEALLKTLDDFKAPLPDKTTKELAKLLKSGAKDPGAAVEKIQKLLDVHCLVGVTINPESRVKAARGPAAADLRLKQQKIYLVKVQNEAGVTHALKVAGPQVRESKQAEKEGWLEAQVYEKSSGLERLTGQKVEYVILRLTARESGKREATLKFDVGQGTQDLGFRAEVPILFTIR